MVSKFFDKKTSGSDTKNEIISSKELAEELHKPIIRKFKRIKVRSTFIDNIWSADLADMQVTIKFNERFRFSLLVIEIYSKYAWVIPLKDKKVITITNAFQKIFAESKGKPNKILIYKCSKFYNRSMKLRLDKNAVEMYSTHNEEKSVVAERFIRRLKNEIYKYMTSISKSGYIDKLDDIVNKYNNAYHSTIKMNPAEVKSSTYIDSSKQINYKDSKFKVKDIVRISKCKNIFAKGYVPNWSEEIFVINFCQQFKTLCRGHMLLVILKEKKLLERLTEKNCKKQIKKSLHLKK